MDRRPPTKGGTMATFDLNPKAKAEVVKAVMEKARPEES